MDSGTPQQHRSTDSTFIPSGVDAGSWLGFERKIQERRFQALLITANAALAAGDHAAAYDALTEARALRPTADELSALESRLADSAARERRRGPGAAALLLFGVTLLLAVDALHMALAPDQTTAAPPLAAPLTVREVAPLPVATADGAVMPVATAGRAPEPETAVAPNRGESDVNVAPRPTPRTVDEVPDQRRRAPATSVELARAAAAPPAPATVESGSIDVVLPPAPVVMAAVRTETPVLATPAPASFTPVPASVATRAGAVTDDKTLVSAALRRYARAYTELDARATRQIWPSVDERALANAFAGLRSQSVDFEDCEVVVRVAEADAVCRGTASYVTRVGSSSPRVEARTWHFELSRHDDQWLIDSAVARR